jgi:hypothetical protein
MATILEALQNANFNLNENPAAGTFAEVLGKAQLRNAVVMLDKGYGLSTDIEAMLLQHRDLSLVPECGA